MRITVFFFFLFHSVVVFAGSLEPAIVVPNGFEKIPYSLKLPSSCGGVLPMMIPALDNDQVMFAVGSPPQSTEKAEAAARDKIATVDYESLDSLFALYQPYLRNITAYKPMYFLVGADPQNSKFQISFKYRFLNSEGSLAEQHPWVKGFHFAYTQTSFWDLKSASAPFEDTSYKPELFFQTTNIETGLSGIKKLFFKLGSNTNPMAAVLNIRAARTSYMSNLFLLFLMKKIDSACRRLPGYGLTWKMTKIPIRIWRTIEDISTLS